MVLSDQFAHVFAAGAITTLADLFIDEGPERVRQGNVHGAHGASLDKLAKFGKLTNCDQNCCQRCWCLTSSVTNIWRNSEGRGFSCFSRTCQSSCSSRPWNQPELCIPLDRFGERTVPDLRWLGSIHLPSSTTSVFWAEGLEHMGKRSLHAKAPRAIAKTES